MEEWVVWRGMKLNAEHTQESIILHIEHYFNDIELCAELDFIFILTACPETDK